MMDYIVCKEPGIFEMAQKPVPTSKANHSLVKITHIGICGTDIHAYGGNQAFFTYPRILGHELAGTILQTDSDASLDPGDKVVIMPYMSCGHCIACRNNKTNCCVQIEVLGVHTDGGMQEIISVPNKFLLPANDLTLEQIAIVEPLAIGAHAIRRSQIRAGQFVLVMGCGPIGIGIMQFAKLHGAKVIALDMNEDRLGFVQRHLGVEHTVLANAKSEEEITHITAGDLCQVVIDATGNKSALESGIKYMSHGGTFTLVGLSKGVLEYRHPELHAKETSLLCSRNATLEDFEYVMNVLRNDQFPVDAFITHRASFGEMISTFDSWLDPTNGVIKALVSIDQ